MYDYSIYIVKHTEGNYEIQITSTEAFKSNHPFQ